MDVTKHAVIARFRKVISFEHFPLLFLFFFSPAESKQDLSLNISTNGAASINVSVEVNGTIYTGEISSCPSASRKAEGTCRCNTRPHFEGRAEYIL